MDFGVSGSHKFQCLLRIQLNIYGYPSGADISSASLLKDQKSSSHICCPQFSPNVNKSVG